MSKVEKKKTSFTPEERSEFFNQAEQEYLDKTYGKIPPLDKSFMKADKSNEKSPKYKRYSLIAIAAVAMICIVSLVQPLIGDNESYGEKGILHRLYNSVMGIETDEQDGNDQERVSQVEIYDLKDIDEAKNLCEELYVPQYLPEGFKLEKLTVEKSVIGTDVDYTFKNGKKEIWIGMSFMDSDTATYSSNIKGKTIRLEDRIIVPADDKTVVEMFTEEGIMMISGDAAQDEMIKIAKNLKKK